MDVEVAQHGLESREVRDKRQRASLLDSRSPIRVDCLAD